MTRIGFIGLGLMGQPMARRLLACGYDLVVWNRTPAKAEPVIAAGARWADSPAAVARQVEVVILMVTDSAASEAVICGPEGVLQGARPGLVIIDMSSIAPADSRRLAARAREQGVAMLDAPVTGSVSAAAAGELGIMVGGPEEVFAACRPILAALGTKIVYAGPNGAGCTLKLLNNLILGIAVAAVGEAFVLATRLGIDPRLLQEITSVGGARTGAMESRGPRMLARDFAPRFSIDNQYKDLANVLALAAQAQVPLPVTTLVQTLYQAARAQGKGGWDSAAVVTVLESLAGVTVGAPTDRPAGESDAPPGPDRR